MAINGTFYKQNESYSPCGEAQRCQRSYHYVNYQFKTAVHSYCETKSVFTGLILLTCLSAIDESWPHLQTWLISTVAFHSKIKPLSNWSGNIWNSNSFNSARHKTPQTCIQTTQWCFSTWHLKAWAGQHSTDNNQLSFPSGHIFFPLRCVSGYLSPRFSAR